MREPSSLFKRIKVDLGRQTAAPLQPSPEAWLAARAGFIESLALQLPREQAGFAAAAVAALANASVEPQLQALTINFGGAEAWAVADLMAALGSATRVADKLLSIAVKNIEARCDRSACFIDPPCETWVLEKVASAGRAAECAPRGRPAAAAAAGV